MFGINWSDPETLWLNVTNAALGVVVLITVGIAVYGVITELVARWRLASQMNREMKQMLSTESHLFHSPELGFTMADGGEPEKPAEPGKKSR